METKEIKPQPVGLVKAGEAAPLTDAQKTRAARREAIAKKAADAKPEPTEEVTLKAPLDHEGSRYNAGDTVRLPKSVAEFVRKAQGIK
jgi:hypothetical protein